MTQDATDALETLVDRHGLANVIGALAIVCELKADHISTNWQDARLARAWERCGRFIGRMEGTIRAILPG